MCAGMPSPKHLPQICRLPKLCLLFRERFRCVFKCGSEVKAVACILQTSSNRIGKVAFLGRQQGPSRLVFGSLIGSVNLKKDLLGSPLSNPTFKCPQALKVQLRLFLLKKWHRLMTDQPSSTSDLKLTNQAV